MTYGHVMGISEPIEVYAAPHAEVDRRTPGGVDGLLEHVLWATVPSAKVVRDGSGRCGLVLVAVRP